MNLVDIWQVYVEFIGRVLNTMIRNRNVTMISLLAIFCAARLGLLDPMIGRVSVIINPLREESCADTWGGKASFDFGTTPCKSSVRHLLGLWPISTSVSNANVVLKDDEESACFEGSKGTFTIQLKKPIVFTKLGLRAHPRAKERNPRDVIIYGSKDNAEYRALMEIRFDAGKGSQIFYYKGTDNSPVKYIKISVVSNFGAPKTTLQRAYVYGVDVETTALAAA
ncbi:Hypothetical predicted protein [Cloeon dipterum]|uniref:SUN domain-containing protein n=1 Tax=Cloeon dipterum TaxID=197152 RepID=A0A8S1C257_9INSE|nr:Hypothetical predicted protein [Cloeon dipterum]